MVPENVTRRAQWQLALLLMGTQLHVSAPSRSWRAAALLLALAAGAACGGGTNSAASHTPSPVQASPAASGSAPPTSPTSSSPAPQPVTGAYGLLVGGQGAGSYTVSLVGVDGRVAAS